MQVAAPFSVTLDFFSGPLDLLLHLVNLREVPVSEVDMTSVCNQYLEIVNRARFLDLELASEFLVIAATLLAMKSQALLPNENIGEEGAGLDYDPHFFENLRARLMAYEETKLRAISLISTPQLGVDTFGRSDKSAITAEEDVDTYGDGLTLGTMFLRLLKRVGDGLKSFTLRVESISVISFMMKIVDRLQVTSSGSLLSLASVIPVAGRSSKARVRGSVTGAFVALLELAKRGMITVSQTEKDIKVTLRDGTITGEMSSEFDVEKNEKVVQLADFRPLPETADEVEQEEVRKEANRE